MYNIKDLLHKPVTINNAFDIINITKIGKKDCLPFLEDIVYYIGKSRSSVHEKYFIFTNNRIIYFDPKDPSTKKQKLEDYSNDDHEKIISLLQLENKKARDNRYLKTFDLVVDYPKITKIDTNDLLALYGKTITKLSSNGDLKRSLVKNGVILNFSKKIEKDLSLLTNNTEKTINQVIAGEYLGFRIHVIDNSFFLTENDVEMIPLNSESVSQYIIIEHNTYKKAYTGIGEAVVGGILFGPLGAIIGGLSVVEGAKKKSDMYIQLSNGGELILRISDEYLNKFKNGVVKIVKGINDNIDIQSTNQLNDDMEKLKELKKLLDEGVIDNEEFVLMKKKIVNG